MFELYSQNSLSIINSFYKMDKVPHKDFCIIMVIIFTLIIFLIFWSCMITSFVSSYSYIICVQVRLLNDVLYVSKSVFSV